MSINKHLLLTAVLLVLALSAAPFTKYVAPHMAAAAAYGQAVPDNQAKPDSIKAGAPEKEQPADASIVLYRVMGTVLVIWIGIAVYLFRIDRKLLRLQNEIRGKK